MRMMKCFISTILSKGICTPTASTLRMLSTTTMSTSPSASSFSSSSSNPLSSSSSSSSASSLSSSLLTSYSGNTATIVLNRPKALNALDLDMCVEIRDLLLTWRRIGLKDVTTPGALLVKGAGGKAFCAGGDVKSIWQEIVSLHPQSVPSDDIYIGTGRPGRLASDFFRAEYQMNYLLGTFLVPQVSFWDGIVMGGGVGVSVLGDFRVATEKTLFAMPETAIGLFPDVGSSGWLPHLKSGFGNFIGLTGSRLKGPDLVYAGIATHYVKSEQLPELESEIMKVVTEDPVSSRKAIKGVLKQFKTELTDDFLSQSYLKSNEQIISEIFHEAKSVEDIMFKLKEHSEKGNNFAQTTLETLLKLSPTSLKITLEQLRLGKDMDLKAGLEMEFRMMMKCMAAPDFREGIRAVLVDKDNKPRWSPNEISKVSNEDVKKYFQSLNDFELNLDFNM